VPRKANGVALRQVRTLFNLGTFGTSPDGQLLERAMAGGEAAELAFAALVERHGPTVYGICRAVLRDEHEAQDAFQATFLVLVGKARGLWVRESLGPWLQQVAYRVASCARSAVARRRRHERRYAERASINSAHGERDGSVGLEVREEVDRLPERYRAAVRLCDLEGRTHEEAARQLGWPVGTVKSRLARGRERLRGRLVRRGLAPAAVPAALVEATARAARHVAEGGPRLGVVPASVVALVEGALSAMFMSQIKCAVAAAVLAVGLIATGAAVVAQQTGRAPGARAAAAKAESAGSDPVAAELEKLDLELLTEDVRQLRDQVEVTRRYKPRAERGGSDVGPDGMTKARADYEAARAAYLAAARELRRESRRLARANASDDRQAGGGPIEKSAPGPATTIGSIDMDAVLKRFEKLQRAAQTLKDAAAREGERLAREQKRLTELQSRLKLLGGRPGGADIAALEDEIASLRSHIETDQTRARDELSRREAQTLAALSEEIQTAINAVAMAKGLTYVVKISPRPPSDSNVDAVRDALGRSVLYADPRTDITEEVIRGLNRRPADPGSR
jgi:RNA polymerase sigma factor (sigma-70 family)